MAKNRRIRNLVNMAREADVITARFGHELLDHDNFENALDLFYRHITEHGGDPELLLKEWGIIE